MAEPVDIKDTKRLLRALIYGDAKQGKTTLAAQFVENKGIIFTTDSNWQIITGMPEASKISRVPFEGFSQIRMFAEANAEGIEPFCNYDTLIWDTVSTGVQDVLSNLVETKKLNDQRDPDLPSWGHYNLIASALKKTVRALSKSNLNVIYLTHMREPSADEAAKGKLSIRSNMPVASFDIVAQEVSLIGWLHKENTRENRRMIQFNGTATVMAGSQIPTVQEKTYLVTELPTLIKQWKSQ